MELARKRYHSSTPALSSWAESTGPREEEPLASTLSTVEQQSRRSSDTAMELALESGVVGGASWSDTQGRHAHGGPRDLAGAGEDLENYEYERGRGMGDRPAANAGVGIAEVLQFCIPALGALLADPLMSLVDTVCVGQVSALQLAALGPNTAIFGFVNQVFSFLTTATTGLVAFRITRGEYVDAGRKVSNALVCAVALGLVTTTTMFLGGSEILGWFATSPELQGPALTYLRARCLSIPALLVSTVCVAACLGQKDPRTPLKVSAVVGIFNLVADLYLVLGPPQWGVLGAAVATSVAQYIGAAIYLGILWRRSVCPLHLRIPTLSELKPFFTTSSVLVMRSLCLCVALATMTYHASALGSVTIAGHQVAIAAMTVSQFVPEPISQCAQSMLAHKQNWLPSQEEKVANAKLAVLLLKCAVASGLLMSMLTALPAAVPSWFVADPAVQAAVRSAGMHLSMASAFLSVVCVSDGLLLAALDYKYCMLTNLANLMVIGGFLQWSTPSGLPGVWCAMVLFQGSRLVQNLVRLHQRRMLNPYVRNARDA